MRSGKLYESGIDGTKIGSGKVVYNAPYARRMYYGLGFRFNSPAIKAKEKIPHPLASAQWFEKGKAAKLKHWENGVNRIMKSK